MDARKESLRLLSEHAVLERHGKHETWRLNGHLIAVTGTKTDDRGWRNKLGEIRRALKQPYSGQRCNGHA